jgi:glycosyltransferase involved in cell wall biosynthesis
MKRILETVRAFRKLAPPNWELHIAGQESEDVNLALIAKAAGPLWQFRVQYLGHFKPDQLAVLYLHAHALVLLSHRENFGHVVAEALGCGTPVVISENVDLAPVIRDACAGLIFDVRSEDDVELALQSLFSTPLEKLADMGRKGYDLACGEFSLDRFETRLGSMLDGLTQHANA